MREDSRSNIEAPASLRTAAGTVASVPSATSILLRRSSLDRGELNWAMRTVLALLHIPLSRQAQFRGLRAFLRQSKAELISSHYDVLSRWARHHWLHPFCGLSLVLLPACRNREIFYSLPMDGCCRELCMLRVRRDTRICNLKSLQPMKSS